MPRGTCSHITQVRPNGKQCNERISVIILAASSNHRMKSYGPKSLLAVDSNKYLLQYQINNIAMIYPNSEIITVVGFGADKIYKSNITGTRFVENTNYENTNDLENIRLALVNCIYNKVMIINGDIYFNQETIDSLYKYEASIIIDDKNNDNEKDIGVTVVNDKATIFSYSINQKKWCGILYISNHILIKFKDICMDRTKNKLYTFEALNIMLEKNVQIQAIKPNKMFIYKIDSSKDLDRLL